MRVDPRVSIIIPVYNGADYLDQAIRSALDQTYNNLEVIVVNDGSNDGGQTDAIAEKYEGKIQYFKKANGGVASALNYGIERMSGDFFSWLSHDDIYYPNKIKANIEFLKTLPSGSVIYSDYDYIDRMGKVIGHYRAESDGPRKFRMRLITEFPIHGCTALIPKNNLLELRFDESLRTTQDYDLWFRMSEKYKFYHQGEALMQSRVHNQQGSVVNSRLAYEESTRLYRKFLNEVSENEIDKDFGVSRDEFYVQAAGGVRRKGQLQLAREYLSEKSQGIKSPKYKLRAKVEYHQAGLDFVKHSLRVAVTRWLKGQ